MLNIVAERFLKIADRHLTEAKIWLDIATSRNDLFGKRYANDKCDAHLQMARYWHMAVNNLHYKKGTWAYTF